MTELADFSSERIEGITREGAMLFECPLYSQIKDNLWMGGCPRGSAPSFFKFIVCLYPWGTYAIEKHHGHFQMQMLDEAAIPNVSVLEALADMARAFAKVGPTLVHCQAGLNRSGLITTLALIRDGLTPEEAVALVRKQRCDAVLCNKTFERWLLAYPGKPPLVFPEGDTWPTS